MALSKENTTLPDDRSLIPVRMLTEYVYCPRLAYLEWVHGEWRESPDTVEGSLVHRRVDRQSGALRESDDGYGQIVQVRSVAMSAEQLGLTTVMDLVEQSDGRAVPIEYKKASAPDSGPYPADRIQVAAQALILRENGYHVSQAAIYYAGSHRRVDVDITEELTSETLAVVEWLRKLPDGGTPPVLVDSPKCPRCSLVSICLPDETRLLQLQSGDDDNSTGVRRLVPSRSVAQHLYLTQAGTSLGKSGGRLEVREKKTVLAEVRLNELDHVSIFGNVQISTQALQSLMDEGIPVTYFSGGGWFYGYSIGTLHKNVLLRKAQFRAADDPPTALSIAKAIVYGKISNCRTLLRRDGRGIPDSVLGGLRKLASDARRAQSLGQLIGIEGAAARIYFQHFSHLLKLELPFEWQGRNRRPPKDPVNSLLSLGYALLTKQATITLCAIGFDPFMGFLHQTRYGKPALALDMMEEFRPLIVDSVVITAINTGELAENDFIVRNGTAALTSRGRKTFIAAFERRLDAEVTHPVFSYRVSYRRILEIQGRLLARLLLGEISEYPTFRTR